jgi:probable rRNA maturation factor
MIRVDVHTGGRAVDEGALVEAATAALRARGVARAELSVALLDDDGIRELNARHLGHDRVTDVIAFGLWEEGDALVVGDVYVGADQARRQAADAAVGLGEEFVRLVVHGTLHVTGMDHPDDGAGRATSPMYRLQEHLVARLAAARPGPDAAGEGDGRPGTAATPADRTTTS